MTQIFIGFSVSSCADGTMRVEPEYTDEFIGEEGQCQLGLLDRMSVAQELEGLLAENLDQINKNLDPDYDPDEQTI